MRSFPEFPNFSHAVIESVFFNGYDRIDLFISPLKWEGIHGRRGNVVQIRLHGLENGQATNDLLNEKRAEISEVGYCGYSRELKSKAGHVIIEICSERYDTVILIHCRDVTVMMNDDAK